MLARLVIAIVGAIVLTACGHHAGPETHRRAPTPPHAAASSTRPTSPDSLDCSAHIPANGPVPASYRVVLGAVALQVWPAAGVLQASADHTVGAPRFFAKTGLLVRAGVSSTITVQGKPHRVARIGWRNASVTPARRVEVPPCPPDGSSGWLAFPGGYWVDRPTCVTVTIRAQGGVRTERVAVGSPCS